jgi:hypothetical protein
MMPLSYPAILLLHTYNVLPSKSTETFVYQTWSSSTVNKPISGRISVQETHRTTPLLSIYSYLTHVQKYLTTECTTRKKEEPSRTYLSSPYHGVEQCIPCNHGHLWISQSSHHGHAYSCFHPAYLILDCTNFTKHNNSTTSENEHRREKLLIKIDVAQNASTLVAQIFCILLLRFCTFSASKVYSWLLIGWTLWCRFSCCHNILLWTLAFGHGNSANAFVDLSISTKI